MGQYPKRASANDINSVSLRGAKRLRGKAEANPEIPRSARNKLRNLKQRRDCRALRPEHLAVQGFGLAMTVTVIISFVLFRQVSNDIYLQHDVKGQAGHLNGCPDRWIFLEILTIDFIHPREIVHIAQEDRSLQDMLQG